MRASMSPRSALRRRTGAGDRWASVERIWSRRNCREISAALETEINSRVLILLHGRGDPDRIALLGAIGSARATIAIASFRTHRCVGAAAIFQRNLRDLTGHSRQHCKPVKSFKPARGL